MSNIATYEIEELLKDTKGWYGTDSIVRQSIQALYDLILQQGLALRNQERQVQNLHQNNLSIYDNQFEMRKSSSSQILGQSRFSDEIWKHINSKASIVDVENEIYALNKRIDDVQCDVIGKIPAELELLKSGVQDLQEEIVAKANSNTVNHQLSQKLNAVDVEAALAEKADLHLVDSLIRDIKGKLDKSEAASFYYEMGGSSQGPGYIDQIWPDLSKRIERSDMAALHQLVTEAKREIREEFSQTYIEIYDKIQDYEVKICDIQSKGYGDSWKEINKLGQLIGNKADFDTVVDLVQNNVKDWNESMASFREEIQYDYKRLQRLIENVEKRIEQLNSFSDEVEKNITEIDLKSTQNYEDYKEKIKQEFLNQVYQFSQDQQFQSKNSEFQQSQFRDQILKLQQDIQELQEAMLHNSKAIPASIKQIRTLLDKRLGTLEVELFKQLNLKAEKEEMDKLVKNNFASGQIERALNEKLDRREIEDILMRVEQLQQSNSIQTSRNIEEICQETSINQRQIEQIFDLLNQKVGQDYIEQVIQDKPSINEINELFYQFQQELDQKVNHDEFEAQNYDLSQLKGLASQGKWVWKSGSLINNRVVPWELEITNSDPSNFIWEKGRGNILIQTSGIYELALGIFGRRTPKANVILNNENVLSTVNTVAYPISKGRTKKLIGATLFEFIVVGRNSRISINVSGDEIAEGFIVLNKIS